MKHFNDLLLLLSGIYRAHFSDTCSRQNCCFYILSMLSILYCFRLIGLSVVFTYHRKSFDLCDYGYLLEAYCIGMIVILSVHILIDIIMVYVSMQGTITNLAPRRHMVVILGFKMILFLPELALTIMGKGLGCKKKILMHMCVTWSLSS